MELRRILLGFCFLQGVAAGPGVPTAAQLNWQNNFGAIIHYNMATMVGTQGCNRGNWLQSNNPKSFNVRQAHAHHSATFKRRGCYR